MNESTKINAIVGYHKNINNNAKNHNKKPPTSKNKRKMFKGMNIIKIALYMLRKKGDKSNKKLSPSFPASTNATLTNLVGAFRPLHLQGDVGGMSTPPPPLYPSLGLAEVVERPGDNRFESSPAYNPKYAASSSSLSSSSEGGMSRYASAQSLYDLDNHDADEEEEGMIDDGDAYYDGLEGDEMIDAKADMFIAKFYQQMRLQP